MTLEEIRRKIKDVEEYLTLNREKYYRYNELYSKLRKLEREKLKEATQE